MPKDKTCEECVDLPAEYKVSRETNRRTRYGTGREDVPVIVYVCELCLTDRDEIMEWLEDDR